MTARIIHQRTWRDWLANRLHLWAPAAVVGWAVIQLKLQQRLEKWAETHPPKRRGKV